MSIENFNELKTFFQLQTSGPKFPEDISHERVEKFEKIIESHIGGILYMHI